MSGGIDGANPRRAPSFALDSVQNRAAAEPPIDHLHADLLCGVAYLNDPRFEAGFCPADARMAMADYLAASCRQHGFDAITDVELRVVRDTLQEVLAVWNQQAPDRHLVVPTLTLLDVARPHLPPERLAYWTRAPAVVRR